MNAPFEWLGRQDYQPMWERLKHHADLVALGHADEVVWACEHEHIYTTGRRGIDNRLEHQLSVPWVVSDRGGETTYHGTGQLMLYPIIHIRARGLGVRQYIYQLEQSAIDVLADYGVKGERKDGFPGVWLGERKIAAMGVRVAKGVAYHGMALNMNVDMKYFHAINPCGTGMAAINMQDVCDNMPDMKTLAAHWAVKMSIQGRNIHV